MLLLVAGGGGGGVACAANVGIFDACIFVVDGVVVVCGCCNVVGGLCL